MSSGTKNNLKVGGTRPTQSAWIFLVVPLHFFGSKSTIRRVGERFCDGQYSLVSFLFSVIQFTVPPRAQSFVKLGGTWPRAYGVGATVHVKNRLLLRRQVEPAVCFRVPVRQMAPLYFRKWIPINRDFVLRMKWSEFLDKFDVDLMNIYKVTSCKTKRLLFFAYPLVCGYSVQPVVQISCFSYPGQI